MKIEKCPFCGKDVAEISNCQELEECRHFEKCPATGPYVCVVCNIHEGGCGASSGYYVSEAKAIAAWNSRADAVPVVRCRECKYYENTRLKVFENCCRKDLLIPMKPNDYCSYGERKEDNL